MFTLTIFISILDYFRSMMKKVLIFFPEEETTEDSSVSSRKRFGGFVCVDVTE